MKPSSTIDMPGPGLQKYNNAWFARGKAPRPHGYIVARDQAGQRVLTLPYPVTAGQEMKTLQQILHHLKKGDTLTIEKTL